VFQKSGQLIYCHATLLLVTHSSTSYLVGILKGLIPELIGVIKDA